MRILLITSKWPIIGQEIDGGCMTTFNVLDSIVGFANIDILLPEGYKGITIPEIDKTYYYPVTQSIIDNYNGANKFMCRIKIAELIGPIVLNIFSEYDRIIVLHTFHAFSICNGCNITLQQKVILFPMLLTPSYVHSGEVVPEIYTQYEQSVLCNVNFIITPSIYERNQIINYYHVDSQKVSIIPRYVGCEFKYFEKNHESNSRLNICYIASIKKQKQNIKSLELLKKLLLILPNCFLYIVGPIHDNTEYSKLIDYINVNGLGNNVSIIMHLSQSEINKLFSTCFVNISVSRCETFGRAIIEGLYCGLPAFVLTDTECFKILIGNDNGVEYFNSIDNMATRIVEVYYNCEIYQKLRKKARSYGLLFDEKIIKPQLIDALLC